MTLVLPARLRPIASHTLFIVRPRFCQVSTRISSCADRRLELWELVLKRKIAMLQPNKPILSLILVAIPLKIILYAMRTAR